MIKLDAKAMAVLAAAALIIFFRLRGDAKNIIDGVSKFGRALSFDKSQLGPEVKLTDRAQLTEQQYIDAGYLQRLPNGSTKITPEGELYIAQHSAGFQ